MKNGENHSIHGNEQDYQGIMRKEFYLRIAIKKILKPESKN